MWNNVTQPIKTYLHKFSTCCSSLQILDMNETEIGHLSRHLGHDPKTHREFYRLTHSTIQLSKVLPLLLCFCCQSVFCKCQCRCQNVFRGLGNMLLLTTDWPVSTYLSLSWSWVRGICVELFKHHKLWLVIWWFYHTLGYIYRWNAPSLLNSFYKNVMNIIFITCL